MKTTTPTAVRAGVLTPPDNDAQFLAALRRFPLLPDEARVPLPVVCALHGVSPATVWRRVRSGLLPAPVKEGGTTRWIAGDLRAKLAREVA